MKYFRSALALIVATCVSLAAAVPQHINYQAKLADASGAPLQGNHLLLFTIYQGGDADVTTGVAVYDEFINAAVTAGVVNHAVGTGTSSGGDLTPALFDYSGDMFLGVAVDTPGNVILPRLRLASVPFAFRSAESDLLGGQPASYYATSATVGLLSEMVTAASATNDLPRSSSAYVIAETTSNSVTNGTNLLAAYDQAKALTPHGQPLSASNRAALILPPGVYDLQANSLVLDTEFVDVVGLSPSRADQRIVGDKGSASNTGLIRQTASDVHLSNLTFDLTADFFASSNATYYPDTNLPSTVIRNCEFSADFPIDTMRLQIEYSGQYIDCKGAQSSFGNVGGVASGTFIRCEGGDGSFNATASGTFIDCKAGDVSFGFFGDASGWFINCTGQNTCFGHSGYASGTFINCTATNNAFGNFGTANGVFTNCTAGNESFGFNGTTAGGIFHGCRAGTGSFTLSGSPQPQFRDCFINGSPYLTNTSAQVTAGVGNDASVNGQGLLRAYAQAKLLTPNGQAKSTTDRVALIVPPGAYDLGSAQLVLDSDYVDVIGQSSAREDQYIFSTSSGANTGVLRQTANDIRIENLVVHCTRSSGGVNLDSSDPAAYFADSDRPQTVIRNCDFRGDVTNAFSMRRGITYSGTYEKVTGGVYAFGGFGVASGKFISCTGAEIAFGANGIASGTFTDCTAGGSSFGAAGTASGNFIRCSGSDAAFGSYGTASGNFSDCTAGVYSFGSEGNATGTFTDCKGGNYSFGGNTFQQTNLANGRFVRCTGGDFSFGGSPVFQGVAGGAQFTYCTGGLNSFTSLGLPLALYCIKANAAYP